MKRIITDKCHNCGKTADFFIAEDATLYREATCEYCGVSIRTSDLLENVKIYLSNLNVKKNDLKILNLCSFGFVHETLKEYPGYFCGEFFDGVTSGEKYNSILCVDLQNIPFEDKFFDLIISEDVLEHVENIDQAFIEINRVLKLGRSHIFTVPLHENTLTMSRKNNPNKVFHGDPLREAGALVYTDFGKDVARILSKFGMDCRLREEHRFFNPDEISYIDDEYEHYLVNRNNLPAAFRYNSAVFIATKVRDIDRGVQKHMAITTKTLSFTGERFVPGKVNGPIIAEHMQRYKSLAALIRGKKVLDAACGAGYGSAILAESAESVVGIDISKETVDYAKEQYKGLKNVQYIEGSIDALPFEDKTFDVIVSFETIEHVNADLQEKFLREIKRCLKFDGVLVMSSPDKKTYSDDKNYRNIFHVHEFYADEFEIFLKQAFKNVSFYRQGHNNDKIVYLRKVNDKSSSSVILTNDFHVEVANELYIVAVCSDKNIDNVSQRIDSIYAVHPHEDEATAYPLIDGKYSWENAIFPQTTYKNGVYKSCFSLREINVKRLRFDPLEGTAAEVELVSIKTDAKDYAVTPLNAYSSQGNIYKFYTNDPMFEITGDFTNATFILIEYTIKDIPSWEIYGALNETGRELAAANRDIAAIKSTRGYKALERIRLIRKKMRF